MTKGIEDGADFLELDVQESADDEVIVMHDSDYMKLAGVEPQNLGCHHAGACRHRHRKLV